MSRHWRLNLTLAVVGVAWTAAIIGVASWNQPGMILAHWPDVLCLTQPPFWGLVVVWLARRCAGSAQSAVTAATAALAVALTAGVVFTVAGHGYLGPNWRAPNWVTPLTLMAVPAAVTVVAGGWVLAERYRRATPPEEND